MKSEKEKYEELCKTEKTIPIFSQPWWLDTVVGENNWDVLLYEKGGDIFASWPVVIEEKLTFKILTTPQLTPNLGLRFYYPDQQKSATKRDFEREIIFSLVKKLPKFAWFKQSFHYDFTNWQPFFWLGFKQTTLYTYVISNVSDLGMVYNNFMGNVKRNIKKAKKQLTIEKLDDVELFYKLYNKTFSRQNMSTPYSYELIKKIYTICKEKKNGEMLMAVDDNGQVHAVNYFVWDNISLYYLLGAGDPQLRNSGASSLLMWEGIQIASKTNKIFDFEGSMVQPIARFFSAFGGELIPYFKIEKINSPVIKFKRIFK